MALLGLRVWDFLSQEIYIHILVLLRNPGDKWIHLLVLVVGTFNNT